MTVFSRPGSAGALMSYESRYQNFIGGQWVAPVHGRYFENPTPVTGQPFCEVPRSDAADIDKALDAAHAAAPGWGKTAPAERAAILNMIADRIDKNAAALAVAEVWDNGKPVREALAADIPLAVDHFRYFAAAIRAQEGALSQIDEDTVAYHFHEPLGVVGQIIPWNFPILMAAWKLAPALAAGNTAVLKPAEQTPASVLYLMSLIGDLLPPGVVNVVNGFGAEAGKPLASSDRIAKVAFTGETTTGRLIMQYASHNLIPVTLELGGKSPNIFFADVLAAHDDFCDKALEGFTMFALNQGEVCTCPSRSLIQADIYDEFLELAAIRTKAVRQGDPLDNRNHAGFPGLQRPAGKGVVLHRNRQARGCGDYRRRRARRTRRRPVRRLLHAADDLHRHQQHADFQGGDLRAGGRGDVVHRLRRRDRHRQRHPLRLGCRCVEPRRQHCLSGRAGHPGRPGVGQLLPPLPRARGVRRLQAVRHRPGGPPDDAAALPAHQEPAGVLLG